MRMYSHDFLALCPKGHKRNFVWYDPSPEKMQKVMSNCVRCGEHTITKEVEFTIKEYWSEPKELI